MTMNSDYLKTLIQAGEIHKKVQEYTKTFLRSNVLLWDVTKNIEDKILELTDFDSKTPLRAGIAFPTGVSVNSCAAHWTPNPQDKTQTFTNNDIIKVDFGVHLNGHIVDGAFSYTENPELQPLIDCSVEATETGIRESGVDAVLGDIGASIEEVIKSYSVTIKGVTYPVVSTSDLCGHQIGHYKIHAGKAVPNIAINYPMRMKENEEYAIETFPSTGTGKTRADTNNTSHYMIEKIRKNSKEYNSKEYNSKEYNSKEYNSKEYNSKEYQYILRRFGTLVFCKRWLPTSGFNMTSFDNLVKSKFISEYPPLYDYSDSSYSSQTEKSIFVTDSNVIILN
jgi:methionyl aminopeptidase